MKTQYIILLIFILFSCQQGKKNQINNLNLRKDSIVDSDKYGNSTAGKSFDETASNPSNGIYLKIEDWLSNSWQFSNEENSNVLRRVDTLSTGEYRITDYFASEEYFPRRIGNIGDLNGINPESSGAFGQWFVFRKDSRNIASTGFFKNGLKDSIWVIDYEDYPVPSIEFYHGDTLIPYRGSAKIYDDKGRLWFKSDDIKTGVIPHGVLQFYRYDIAKIMEFEFKEKSRDSIEMFLKIYDLKTKELLETHYDINAKDDEWN